MTQARSPRYLSLLALIAAMSASACSLTRQGLDFTGSIGSTASANAAATNTTGSRSVVDAWGERYRADPQDAEIAIGYAQALRATDQRAQAVAVMEQAALQHPTDMTVLGAYGRALADVGDFKKALDILARAHAPDQPDWRILSAQGAVLDQMGRHDEARRYYLTALKIVPDEPSVLSNLGLSYALSKDLANAEQVLRRAAVKPPVDPRVRQNLALVVGLRGRFGEAEQIARADLPPDEASANVAYLQQMLQEPETVKKYGGKPMPLAPRPVAQKTLAPKTLAPKTVASKTLAPKTLVPKTLVPNALASRTVDPTLAPTTPEPKPVANALEPAPAPKAVEPGNPVSTARRALAGPRSAADLAD